MTQTLRRVFCDQNVRETFDLLLVHQPHQFFLGDLHVVTGFLYVVAFDNRCAHRESLARFELRHQRENFTVLGQVCVEIDQHEYLRTPVFGVRRRVFQPQQTVSSGRQSQTTHPVAPFLFRSTEKKKKKNRYFAPYD